jgi:Fur family peroxide stress response transcriptional regulator
MDKYRNIGLKLTPQRIAILDYLEGNKQHPSAEDIYRAVKRRFPTMSFATVYTTLSALKSKGSVLELTIDGGKKRYDPLTASHNHMICLSCKQIIDIPVEFSLDIPERVKQGFEVTHTHVEFHGFCPKCKT